MNLAPVTAATLTEVGPRQGDRVTTGEIVAAPGARRRGDRPRRGRGRPRPGRGRARQPARGQPPGGDRRHRGLARGRPRPAARGRAPGHAPDLAGRARRRGAGRPRHRARRPRHGPDRGRPARGGADGAAPARPRPGGRRRREPAQGRRGRGARRPLAAGAARPRRPGRRRRSPTSSAARARSAGPTAPVLSLLPDGAYKLVAFVGETAIAGIAPGDRLAVRCDGCPDGLTATVSYVSDEPEFTPAGDLLGREPPEARLSHRGQALRGQPQPPPGTDRRCRPRPLIPRPSSTCAT